ncbi:MAG TPA: class I SAM-dependent methyltransferase [Acidimicrobiia bacterium]|nr:class I SAM-dependent methyltransferase [Acidimicrobiia bacterium]
MHEKRWDEALDELTAEEGLNDQQRARVNQAREVTERLAKAARQSLEQLVDDLSSSGHSVFAGEDPIGLDGTVVIRVHAAELGELVDALEARDYLPQQGLSDGAWRAWGRVGTEIVLLPAKEDRITRVVLRWKDARPSGLLSRVFNPSLADLRAVRLPLAMWWAYWLVRPVRVLADRIVGRRAEVKAPYLSTPTALVVPLLELVSPARGDYLIDLGCGDGRVLIEAARLFGCTGTGVESDARLVAMARSAVAYAGLEQRIEIKHADLVETSLAGCNIVFLFLPTAQVARVLPTVLRELEPGAKVLAHEQAGARWSIPPDRTHLVIDRGGVTVAHVWERES